MLLAARQFSQDNRGLRPQPTQDSGVQAKEQFMQFSKEPIMRNFGELAFGEIPEPLKFVRPFNSTTLSNGIRVCSERVPGATAHIGVYVGAGSRNEDLSTTGTSYLLHRMALRGTTNRSKGELAEEIENMGGRYSAHSDREYAQYGLRVFKADAAKAVSLLGDMLCNGALNPAELELLKDEVTAEHD